MRPSAMLAFHPQYSDLPPCSHEIAYGQQVASFVIPVPDTNSFPMTVIALQPENIHGRDELSIQHDHVDSILQKSARKDIAMMKVYRYHGSGVTTSAERGRTRWPNFVLPLSIFIQTVLPFPVDTRLYHMFSICGNGTGLERKKHVASYGTPSSPSFVYSDFNSSGKYPRQS